MNRIDLTAHVISREERRNRTRRTIILVFCCLFILILNSCLQPIIKPDSTITPYPTLVLISTLQSHPTSITKPDSTTTPYPPLVLISTLQSYSTPINVFDYPDQVTDGILLFSVEKITDACYNAGDPIEMKFIFKNVTNKAIKIPSGFSIAANRGGDGGNILPFITSTEGADVYSFADVTIFEIFGTPSNSYLTISGNQESEFVLVYKFPKYITRSPLMPTDNLVTPSPGRYFLRFVYLEYERGIDAWSGAVGSNRVDICITN